MVMGENENMHKGDFLHSTHLTTTYRKYQEQRQWYSAYRVPCFCARRFDLRSEYLRAETTCKAAYYTFIVDQRR